MSDNREIARDLLEKLLIPAEAETMSYDEAIAEIMAFADAATERGRRQGWSADEATVERMASAAWARFHVNFVAAGTITWEREDESQRKLWRSIARAAIAAIPAPPAGESERG